MNNIMRAMMATDPIERDAYANREVLLAAVQRQMFCQTTGDVLDIRTAVLITMELPNGATSARIVTGTAFDAVGGREAIRALAAKHHAVKWEVIDGRDYPARGELRTGVLDRMRAEAGTTGA